MAYTTEAELTALIDKARLAAAQDDDADGSPDPGILASVISAAGDDIDGRIGARYATPVSPVPAAIKAAAKAIALCFFYKRRGVADDANPWKAEAESWQKKLDAIGDGTAQLELNKTPGDAGAVVSEPAKTYDSQDRLLA
ncbi:MAG: phage protein Gp36 family protein [Opitutaceae bacterium]